MIDSIKKKVIKPNVAYKLIFLCLSMLPTHLFASCQLLMGVEDFPPYFIQHKGGGWKGLEIELSEALFSEANCSVTYVNLPWKRSLHLLEYGGLDALASMSKTMSREEYIHFIGPMRNETMSLIIRIDNPLKIRSFNDLKKLSKRIGIVSGEYYGFEFTQKFTTDAVFSSKFEAVDFSYSNVEKLKAGRISGYIGDQYFVAYRLQQEGMQNSFKVDDFVINQSVVYLGLSKQSVSAKNLAKLQAAYRRLHSRGAFQKILAKYK